MAAGDQQHGPLLMGWKVCATAGGAGHLEFIAVTASRLTVLPSCRVPQEAKVQGVREESLAHRLVSHYSILQKLYFFL